jgi:hypothetical protein
MAVKREYDSGVRRSNAATGLMFAASALVFSVLSSAPLLGQINGVPASVTSTGFGGHFDRAPGVPASVTSIGFGAHFDRFPGVPASVTSLGPNGFDSKTVHFGEFPIHTTRPIFERHHHHHGVPVFPVAVPVFALPYAPDVMAQPGDATDEMPEDDDRGGPTIFDRRGSGQPRFSDFYSERRGQVAEQAGPAVSQPTDLQAETAVADQPQTLLVFKDGHEVEVQNYAVVGTTLYDLTPGHSRKVALADLDLKATAKQNDDRGIDFQIPAPQEANK